MSDFEGSSLAREDALRAAARKADAEEQRRVSELTAHNREAARAEYNASDQGLCASQIHESERLMRLPTPETLKQTGAVVGNALKGPSS